ncbi:unnamed protein product, partial [marine sediment metagenome]
IVQLRRDLRDALLMIDTLTDFAEESIGELQEDLEDTAEIAADSKLEAEEAKALATEAKSIADQLQTLVDEANTLADQANTLAIEANAYAEDALKSSNRLTIVAYGALIISMILVFMRFLGPLQITRKT